jgi:toluene monooxygenase system protein E
MAVETDGNSTVLQKLVDKWAPLGDAAIEAYCSAIPDSPDATADAKEAVSNFRQSLGLN